MKYRFLSTTAILAIVGAFSLTPAQAEPDAALRAKLPQSIQDSGVIRVGTDPHNAPYSFYDTDNTTLIGLEHDLVATMEERLGVKFEFSPGVFASIITAVQADRFDMGISAFGDFVEREKIVDEIDYTHEGTGIIVVEGNPHKIAKISDSCGLKAAAVQGSIPLELLNKQASLCPADKPLEILQFPTGDQSVLAVRSGRADLLMDTYGVAAFALANQPEDAGGKKLELVKGSVYAVGYQAMIVGKDKPELRDAVQATLQSMVADGTYEAAFKKWGLEANMLETITVNDAAAFTDYLKLD
jgi:polar amino acid transport system substrate-binding protein